MENDSKYKKKNFERTTGDRASNFRMKSSKYSDMSTHLYPKLEFNQSESMKKFVTTADKSYSPISSRKTVRKSLENTQKKDQESPK